MAVLRIVGLGIVALALTSCAGLRRDLTLDELVSGHSQARGGRAALDAVQSIECELEIVEQGFTPSVTLTGLYRVDRAGRMRIDIYQGGQRVFTEAFDGERGWQQAADAPPEYAKPQAQASLRHGPQLPVNLLSFHDLTARGARLERLGRKTLDGVAYYRLRVTLDDGFATDYYLDPESLLLARARNVSALHPDIEATEKPTETQWSDYRQVSGQVSGQVPGQVPGERGATLRAHFSRTIDLATGRETQTVTVKAMRVNVALDPQLFAKPAVR